MEPVDLADMKTFLRVDTTLDDDLITGLITASRTWCEDYTQRRFINQQWRLGLDFFPGTVFRDGVSDQYSRPVLVGPTAVFAGFQYAILLPYPPAVSVDSFTWKDQNGDTQTLAPITNYTQDLVTQPARLTPLFGQIWPIAQIIANAVQITYTCGYGTVGSEIPAGILVAIKLLVAHWYENRVPAENDIPLAVKAVLGPYRDLRF